MDYNEINTALTTLLVIPVTDPQWISILPSIINDAEGRIYKDMDFLATADTDTSKVFTPNIRELILPDRLVVPEQIGFALAGTVTFLDRSSLEFINAIWPAQATPGDMKWWTLKDNVTAIVAGTPAGAYVAHVHGKFRPIPMSSTNPNTYIGDNHPELLLAACMVFGAGYQRDFGAQSADPSMAVSWETHYQSILKSTMMEEQRRKGQGPGWQPLDPAPEAGTQRS